MSDQQMCPGCKTTKYSNRNMRLMVNVCGHTLCENCVNVYFVRGSGECRQCHLVLRKNNFRDQIFEDAEVEKDTDIRKKVLKDYNKMEDDFATLREYNDYLERVETIIFNLTNGIYVDDTRQEIENYRKDNQEIIRRNKLKMSQDEELVERLLEEEREVRQLTQQQMIEEEEFAQKEKEKQKKELINNLMFSKLPAEHIIRTHRQDIMNIEKKAKPSQIPTQVSSKFVPGTFMRQERFVAPRVETGSLYSYTPLHLENRGPAPPDFNDLASLKYLAHIRVEDKCERAGGFQSNVACYRALQDSFCGLFL